MTAAKRFVPRNRVHEMVEIGIAVVSGVVAAAAGAEPIGSAGVDAVQVFLRVAAVVWASTSALWWASASACSVGAAIVLQPVVAAIGPVGFIAELPGFADRTSRNHVRWSALPQPTC